MKVEEVTSFRKLAHFTVGNPNVLIIDTETTGFGRRAEVLELAILRGDGSVAMDCLIKPASVENWEWPVATKIHGISPKDVAEESMLKGYLRNFSTMFHEVDLVLAWNASFDRGMLTQSARFNDDAALIDTFARLPWMCAMDMYAQHYGQRTKRNKSFVTQSLTKACAQQGFPLKDAHRAMSDCEGVLELLRVTRERWPI